MSGPLKWLRLRSRPTNDNPPPFDDGIDVVNANGRLASRSPQNNYAELFAKEDTPVNSVAKVIRVTPLTTVADGDVFAIGSDYFEFNSSDGSTSSNVGADPVAAQGTLTLTGNPADSDTFVVGPTTYTIIDGTPVAGQVKLFGTAAENARAIAAAVNGADGFNSENGQATAKAVGSTVIFTAKSLGASGDSVVLTESLANATADGSGTLGGTTAGVDPEYVPVDITAYSDKAQGTITVSGPGVENETFVIGTTTYTLKTSPSAANEVGIGASAFVTASNIIAAVNGTDGRSTANTVASAAGGGAGAVVITALAGGVAGDAIVFTEASTVLAMDGSGTLGGTTAGADPSVAEACDAITAAIGSFGPSGSGDVPYKASDAGTHVDLTYDIHGANVEPVFDSFAGTIAQQTAGVDGTPGIQGCSMFDSTDLFFLSFADEERNAFTWRKISHSAL